MSASLPRSNRYKNCRVRVGMAVQAPRKPYTEIESEYIKEQIGDADQFESEEEHREYVNVLTFIEHVVLNGVQNKSDGRGWVNVKQNYPAEADRIQKELRPEDYRERKERERQNEAERKERMEEVEAAETRERDEAADDWKKAKEQFSDG